MKLGELLSRVPGARLISGSSDVTVRRVEHDSRRVRCGDLFVAIKGIEQDGHKFVASVYEAGAVAVVVEREVVAPAGVPQAIVPNGRQALAVFAHALAGEPTKRLRVCGVTGTNGKTTTTYLGESILEHAGHRVGVLGTIGYNYGDRRIRAPMTTPDATTLAGYFADMVDVGVDSCLMEVSSHALHQWRAYGISFRVGAFTNLTPEHLDYHGDMVSYRQAKGRLFECLEPSASAVLNADDEASQSFAASTRARVIWYGLKTKSASQRFSSSAGRCARDPIRGREKVTAGDLQISLAGSRFRLSTPRGEVAVASALIGRHNVYNCLTAAAIAEALGVDLQSIAAGIAAVRTIRGRLEPVEAGQPFKVLVDYAHTDDALANTLTAVKPLVDGRLVLVFGCGGDRDRLKRPRMGRVAEEFADLIFITNDNPRSERPQRIVEEILGGFRSPARATVILDRRDAISAALAEAKKEDLVIIAGKGHETYQETFGVSAPFDDREVACDILQRLL